MNGYKAGGNIDNLASVHLLLNQGKKCREFIIEKPNNLIVGFIRKAFKKNSVHSLKYSVSFVGLTRIYIGDVNQILKTIIEDTQEAVKICRFLFRVSTVSVETFFSYLILKLKPIGLRLRVKKNKDFNNFDLQSTENSPLEIPRTLRVSFDDSNNKIKFYFYFFKNNEYTVCKNSSCIQLINSWFFQPSSSLLMVYSHSDSCSSMKISKAKTLINENSEKTKTQIYPYIETTSECLKKLNLFAKAVNNKNQKPEKIYEGTSRHVKQFI